MWRLGSFPIVRAVDNSHTTHLQSKGRNKLPTHHQHQIRVALKADTCYMR
jgi:hypothetical protein